MRWVVRSAAGLLVAVLALGALNAGAAPAAGPPSSLLGLNVQAENIKGTLAEDRRQLWVDRVQLYTLRSGKELMATLEIARFKKGAPWGTADFQSAVAGSLGTANPVVVRLGGVAVYLTSLRTLKIACWFRDGGLFILAVRQTYAQPKALIRAALGVRP